MLRTADLKRRLDKVAKRLPVRPIDFWTARQVAAFADWQQQFDAFASSFEGEGARYRAALSEHAPAYPPVLRNTWAIQTSDNESEAAEKYSRFLEG